MNISLRSSSTDSDVFYVEQSSAEGSPIRHSTPVILDSTTMSGVMEREVITISSVASPEPRIVTLDSDPNDPTMPFGFGNQYPIVPPSLNDLNLSPNPFNVLATMAVIQVDERDSPQSPEPSIPSSLSSPPMNVSTIEGYETPHTTIDDNNIYSSDNDPRRVYWDTNPSNTAESDESRNVSVAASPSSTPPPPRRQKRKLSLGMPFPQRGECRSTPARHAAKPYPKKSHPMLNNNSKHSLNC